MELSNGTQARQYIEFALKRSDDGRDQRALLISQLAQAHALLAIVDRLDDLMAQLDNMTSHGWTESEDLQPCHALRVIELPL